MEKLSSVIVTGFDVNLGGFYRLASADSLLGPLAERFRGVRPPRFPGMIEALANAVSCQQLSLAVGIGLLNRLSDNYGQISPTGAHGFPGGGDLAGAQVQQLRELGYSIRKVVRLWLSLPGRPMARWVFDDVAGRDNAGTVGRLCELDGIGRWSAEYVMLRGLGRTDVFPGDDVGAQNKLRRWLSLPVPLDYPTVSGIVARWHPRAGLVYLHLLLDSLASAGSLPDLLPLSPGVTCSRSTSPPDRGRGRPEVGDEATTVRTARVESHPHFAGEPGMPPPALPAARLLA